MPNRIMEPSRTQRFVRRLPSRVLRLWDTPIHWLYWLPVLEGVANWLHHHVDFIYESCLTLELREAEDYIAAAEATERPARS